MAIAARQVEKESNVCGACLGKRDGYKSARLVEIFTVNYGMTQREVRCELCVADAMTVTSNAMNAKGEIVYSSNFEDDWKKRDRLKPGSWTSVKKSNGDWDEEDEWPDDEQAPAGQAADDDWEDDEGWD